MFLLYILSEWAGDKRGVNERDHVVIPEDYLEKAKEQYEFQKAHPVSETARGKFISYLRSRAFKAVLMR